MTKEEAWDKFKETGEIKYYMMYKRGKQYMLKKYITNVPSQYSSKI